MGDRRTLLAQLRALAVLASVAELGSFRAAARALGLSPSVVSHHIAELERRLALPLIYRSTRRLALTADGARLAEAAREMVDAAERGLDATSGHSDAPTGSLRVTAPAFIADAGLCRDLAEFAAAYPKVALTASFSEEPRDLLRDGFDVAIRIGRLADSSHKVRKLADMSRVLVGAPGYVHARKAPRAPRELVGWDFVHLSSRPAEVALVRAGKARPVVLGFRPRLAVDSAAAMRALVLAGAGVATLPEVLVRGDLARGGLVPVLRGWLPPAVGIFAVWPGNAPRAALTARLIDFLAPRLAALFTAAG